MSFLSKMNSKFEEMLHDKGSQQPNGEQGCQQQSPYANKGYTSQQQSYAPQTPYSTPQYQNPPPQAQQWSTPSQTPQYQYSPPQQQYGAFSPPVTGLPPTPAVPQGWLPLWDPASQRWAYLDLSSGKVDWNIPPGPMSAQGGFESGRSPGPYQQAGKDSSKNGMMMGAAAGVAVGAVGGMVMVDAFDDDDHRSEDDNGGGSSDGDDAEEAYGSY